MFSFWGNKKNRGCSSIGRALESHSRGRRFDSGQLQIAKFMNNDDWTNGNDGCTNGVMEAKFVRYFEGIFEYLLSNDMQCLLLPDLTQSTIVINLVVLAGSCYEDYGRTGVAHFIEHMLFKKSKNYPDIKGFLEQRGIYFNASTTYDYTNYYAILPGCMDVLNDYLELEADRMVNCIIEQEVMDIEKSVIQGEMNIAENEIEFLLQDNIMAMAYKWHGYGRSTIGNLDDVLNLKEIDLKKFYKKYYHPKNMVLVVSGNIDTESVLRSIILSFGKIYKLDKLISKVYQTLELEQEGPRFFSLQRAGGKSLAGLSYHIPSGSHVDFSALRIVGEMMTMEPCGVLYEKLIKSGIVVDLNCFITRFVDPGLFFFILQLYSNMEVYQNVRMIINVIEEELNSLINEGVFKCAQYKILKKYYLNTINTSKLTLKLSEYIAMGDYRLYFLASGQIKKMKLEDIRRVIKNYFVPSNRTLGIVLSRKDDVKVKICRKTYVDDLFIDVVHKGINMGEKFIYSFYNIDLKMKINIEKKNNCIFLYKKNRGDEVRLDIVWQYGSLMNLKNNLEVFSLLSQMISKGTLKRSHQEIQVCLDKMMAVIDTYFGIGKTLVTAVVNGCYLKKMIDLVYSMILMPEFKDREFNLLKIWEINRLMEVLNEEKHLGFLELDRLQNSYKNTCFFYNADILEQVYRLADISIDKLKSSYDYFCAINEYVHILIGEYQNEDVNVLCNVSKKFKSKIGEVINKQFIQHNPEFKVLTIFEARISIIMLGINLSFVNLDMEFPIVKMFSYIYGEGMNSRLWHCLREQGGYTYDTMSWIELNRDLYSGSFYVYAIANLDNKNEVISILQREFESILTKQICLEEFSMAKSNFINFVNTSISEDLYVLESISENIEIDRNFQFYEEMLDMVACLTVTDFEIAIKRCFDLFNVCIVEIGG